MAEPSNEPIVYLNGEFVPLGEARISVLDQGFLLGDGVFDVVSAWRGSIFKLDWHIERCFYSLRETRLETAMTRQDQFAGIVDTCRLKRHGLKFWSIALEKFGAPSVVGKYPPNASQGQKDDLLDLVHAFATSLGVTLPEGQDIEIIESARRAGGDYEQFVGYLDRMVTTTILGQSSTTDQGPWRGTAEVQKDVRDETVAADCRLLDNALNATISRWLAAWNFQGAAVPRITRDTSPAEDLDARATREETIARTTGLRPTKAHIEALYGGEWEPVPEPGNPAETPPAGDQATLAATLIALARERPGDALGNAVERLALAEWEPMMAPVIEPILEAAGEALERGDTLEQFRARLPELLAAMDDGPIVATLHRMGFTAALSGQAGLDDE